MIATGHHWPGAGQAHKWNENYRFAFNRRMEGTFNLHTDQDITQYEPRCVPLWNGIASFWLIKINGTHYGWVFRSPTTEMDNRVWEVISKNRLPDSMREGEMSIEVLEKWNDEEIAKWTGWNWRNQWHQSFPWTRRESADSQLVWDTIAPHAEWSGATVMDFGCNWGFHCFQAAKAGADVVGVEKVTKCARDINDHIEMQDVQFVEKDPGGSFDIIIYTSVHHQIDETYERLAECLDAYRARCKTLFVELIRPPMFGTEERLEAAVSDATHLLTYKHRIRGVRSICKFTQ